MLKIINANEVEFKIEENLIAQRVRIISMEIKRELEQLEHYEKLYIDLSAVEVIDSIGLSFLVALHKLLKSQGKVMSIRKYSSTILDILKIMKLDEMFEICVSDDAV